MITRTKFTILATVSALALSGCVTNNAEPMGDNTRSGAIIGGMLGAAAGAIGNNSDPGMGAVVGGAAGALAGGAIGAALDRQARDLRGTLANDDILIQNTGQELVVTMPEGILFDIDSAAIRASLQSDLRALARNLQQYPNTTVEVIGHTDNTGSAAYNQDLSARRAQAVAGVLLEAGVSPARVRSFGLGEDQPVASNLTPEGRAQNRRVEVIIRPR
jgi:outer membrane protein OmpA-like peptidoglycan-associated protein